MTNISVCNEPAITHWEVMAEKENKNMCVNQYFNTSGT
jgi:hypothetical protein